MWKYDIVGSILFYGGQSNDENKQTEKNSGGFYGAGSDSALLHDPAEYPDSVCRGRE